MEILNKVISKAVERPIKVMQFGEGNFLRGFIEHMIDVSNELGVFNGNVVIIKPIEFGSLSMFQEQECQYTLSLRGKENGEIKEVNRIITCISDAIDVITEYDKYADLAKCETLRFIVSNTTEAGIAYDAGDKFKFTPPKTYPGKLTKFLFERYTYFNGAADKGLIIIPCELIESNGIQLKNYVLQFAKLWNLDSIFVQWINDNCTFCSTLVDRIITGYPEEAAAMCERFGYQDNLIVTGELFALLVIECDNPLVAKEFPLPKAGLPVIYTFNQGSYRERKVRILNGAHTSFALASFLTGNDFVGQSMQDATVRKFMISTLFDEIIEALSLPRTECEDFANAVIERFENPFIKHKLLDISLNSVSKWKSRCKESFSGYVHRFGKLPKFLTFSIAALMSFYDAEEFKDGALVGHRDGIEYMIKDSEDVLLFFAANSKKSTKEFVENFLCNESFFGEDMRKYHGLTDAVAGYLNDIRTNGMRKTLEHMLLPE